MVKYSKFLPNFAELHSIFPINEKITWFLTKEVIPHFLTFTIITLKILLNYIFFLIFAIYELQVYIKKQKIQETKSITI